MKYIKYFLLFIIFIPFSVYADEICNNNEIVIENLKLIDIKGMTNEKEGATLVNNKIETDVEMYELGDSITYQFTVQNNSNNEYMIDSKNIIDPNNHIEYKLESDNNSYIIKKQSSNIFVLTATYKNEVSNELFTAGKYNSGGNMILEVKNPSLINPHTGSAFYNILFLILAICIIFGILTRNKVFSALSMFVLLILPFITYAYCQAVIYVDFNLDIGYVKPNPCTYNGNLAVGSEYTNGQFTYVYKQHSPWGSAEEFEEDGWSVYLTDKNSTSPVTSRLCTSINNKPIVSMSRMFSDSKATSIDTSSYDTSNVVYFDYTFYKSPVSELDVSNFDTSSATKMRYMFANMTNLQSIDVSSFDTSQVTYMHCMFEKDSSLTELDLSNFRTSNSNSFDSLVSNCTSLVSLNLSNFDFTNFTTDYLMYYIARNTNSLKTLNVSNVIFSNYYGTFKDMTSVEEIILDNVDTSSATDFSNLFKNCTNLKSLDLSSFDASNVTTTSYMFEGCNSLSTAYGRTTSDIAKYNSSLNKPSNVNFVLKSS